MKAVELLDETLSSLKDFQRSTVDALMLRFERDGNQRMLVADEVGLGKTIVAKGIIAELLKLHLKASVAGNFKPLRVTYICSNLTLANENRNKLAVFSGDDHAKYVQEPSYSRLLEVALFESQPADDQKILELCSLTPSTSFNMTSGDGNWRERLIILMALVSHSDLEGYKQKISNLMSNKVKNWSLNVKRYFENYSLVDEVVDGFHSLLDESISHEEISNCGIEGDFKSWKDVLVSYCCNDIRFPESLPVE